MCLNKFVFVMVGVKFVVLDKGEILLLKYEFDIIVLVVMVVDIFMFVEMFISVIFIVVVVV